MTEKKKGWFVAIPLTPNEKCPYRQPMINKCLHTDSPSLECTDDNCPIRRSCRRGEPPIVIKDEAVKHSEYLKDEFMIPNIPKNATFGHPSRRMHNRPQKVPVDHYETEIKEKSDLIGDQLDKIKETNPDETLIWIKKNTRTYDTDNNGGTEMEWAGDEP
jgi:hypothetical protein